MTRVNLISEEAVDTFEKVVSDVICELWRMESAHLRTREQV